MTVSQRIQEMLGAQLIAIAEKDAMIEQLQAKNAELEAKIAELQPKEARRVR